MKKPFYVQSAIAKRAVVTRRLNAGEITEGTARALKSAITREENKTRESLSQRAVKAAKNR